MPTFAHFFCFVHFEGPDNGCYALLLHKNT